MNLIELQVGGTTYPAWTSLRAKAALEHCAGSFELEVTDAWPLGALQDLQPGMECTLTLAGETIITGFMDSLTPEIDARDKRLRLSGRDKTGDLVDCSATIKPYTKQGLLEIASDQAGVYGISVQSNGDLGQIFPKVSVEPGESVWELLERLARQRGVLLMADGEGGLLLGQPKKEAAAADLVLGGNLLALSYTSDMRDRFSVYIGLGQTAGSDDRYGKQAARITAKAEDAYMAKFRTRTKIVRGEGSETDLKARVEWERAVRVGRSLTMRATVQGWTAGAAAGTKFGTLWRVGTLANVQAESIKMFGSYLIAAVTYLLDDQGTRCELELCHPAAYTPEPPQADPENAR